MNKEIVENLNAGKVIAIKTDTVYGLICDATNIDAVNKIYEIKKREKKKPLCIFVKDIDSAKKYIDEKNLSKYIEGIMKDKWPGALTIIFKKKEGVLDHLTAGKTGLGIRIPNDKDLLDILNAVSYPLAETSCNISGESPYKNAKEISDAFGDNGDMIDMIVDGGDTGDSISSTVITVECGEPFILRLGDVKI